VKGEVIVAGEDQVFCKGTGGRSIVAGSVIGIEVGGEGGSVIGEELLDDGDGRSLGRNRGDEMGGRLLCRCRSGGSSIKSDSSSRLSGFWKVATSSSLRVVGGNSATDGDRLTCLVEGAIVIETPRGGLQNDTLSVR
jgi:hypothetical protein